MKRRSCRHQTEMNTEHKGPRNVTFGQVAQVALLFGVCGACRRKELHSLKIQDIVQKDEECLIITIPDTKSNIKRVFPVIAKGKAVNGLELYQKFLRLRPETVQHDYFFICYRNGKCTVQRVGIHSFAKMPSVVAEFLNLPNPKEYTAYCFRRSSASLAADSDVDLISLKRLGGWKSFSVAESYIEESVERKKKICRQLLGEKQNEPSTNTLLVTTEATSTTSRDISLIPSSSSGISFGHNSFQGAQNCSFHFHFEK
ncbi:hypothetical protein Zmor_014538 [Zophobas morio]|uniref:Tyr recombinase domain-containing protein n=1 Tax=Zophobas morio TaxID=2755281 RepID=A0AA38IJZ9_9CUCU|nr:hypothetical protein Zmor_014538 [Zophobas morio]